MTQWNLPTFTWDLDCAPLGYPGIVFELWLNPDIDEQQGPSWDKIADETERAKAKAKAAKWDDWFYYQVARFVREVRIPASYLAGATAEARLKFKGPEDVWKFEHAPGFDSQILQWVLRAYSQKRQERLRAEVGN